MDGLTYATENKDIDKNISKQLKLIEEKLSYKLFCLKELNEEFTITKYLEIRAKAVLQKKVIPTIKKEYATTTDHPQLFDELRELRTFFAQKEVVPNYQIFTQKSLYGMCEMLPITLKELRTISGMGKVRVQKYGVKIVETITSYSIENNIERPEKPTLIVESKKVKTEEKSLQLFNDGLSIKEIAAERGYVVSTIESHLAKFVLSGDLDITDVIPRERYLELKKIISEVKFEGLSDLKTKVDLKFSYSELRLVSQVLTLNKE